MSEKKEEQRFIRDDEIWDEFWHAGATTGSIARDCRHGITFFHNYERAGDFEDGELEKLREKAKADPEHYRALDRDPSFTELLGHEWCWECQKCRTEALKYQTFLWGNRHSIGAFLKDRLASEAKRTAQEKESLTP